MSTFLRIYWPLEILPEFIFILIAHVLYDNFLIGKEIAVKGNKTATTTRGDSKVH
jgi:hypothetical protein